MLADREQPTPSASSSFLRKNANTETSQYSVNLYVIFFYKSNWQNELLRLQRRNKFICAMMIAMQEIGIEGPRRRIPGAKEDTPFYYHQTGGRVMEMPNGSNDENNIHVDNTTGSGVHDPPFVPSAGNVHGIDRTRSILRHPSRTSRPDGESISAMSKRVDFSLGVKDVSSADIMADIDDGRSQIRIPEIRAESTLRSRDARARVVGEDEANRREDEAAIRRAESRTSNSRSPFGLGRSASQQSRVRRGNSLIHRNRFFSRNKRENDGDEEDDLMEQGMADIPETGPSDRMDPRTGVVSAQAVRASTESGSSITNLPGAGLRGTTSSGVSHSGEDRMRPEYLGDIRTEDFELRNIVR